MDECTCNDCGATFSSEDAGSGPLGEDGMCPECGSFEVECPDE